MHVMQLLPAGICIRYQHECGCTCGLLHNLHLMSQAAVLSRLKEAEGEFEHADIAANNNAREPYSDKLAPRTPPRTFERGEVSVDWLQRT